MCKKAVDYEFVPSYRWIFRKILWLDRKDSKYRNCNSTNSILLHHSWCGKYDTKIKWLCPDFPSDAILWITRSGDGWIIGRIEVVAISLWKEFSKFRDAGREDCFCFEQDPPDFPVQKDGQPRKPKKDDRFQRGRQIAFMIHDYFRATGAHDTVLEYADVFSVTLHDDNVQEFDTRWDEVLLSMSKIPSDDILWRIV